MTPEERAKKVSSQYFASSDWNRRHNGYLGVLIANEIREAVEAQEAELRAENPKCPVGHMTLEWDAVNDSCLGCLRDALNRESAKVLVQTQLDACQDALKETMGDARELYKELQQLRALASCGHQKACLQEAAHYNSAEGGYVEGCSACEERDKAIETAFLMADHAVSEASDHNENPPILTGLFTVADVLAEMRKEEK